MGLFSTLLSSPPPRVRRSIQRPTTRAQTNAAARLPSPDVRATQAEQLEKDFILVMIALRVFLALGSLDIISTLTQFYNNMPEMRPRNFPALFDRHFVIHTFETVSSAANRYKRTTDLSGGERAQYYAKNLRDYKDFTECMTDLYWRRYAARVYRAYPPVDEQDPLNTDGSMVDMRRAEYRSGSLPKLVVALRTHIGLGSKDIVEILTKFYDGNPDEQPMDFPTNSSSEREPLPGPLTAHDIGQRYKQAEKSAGWDAGRHGLQRGGDEDSVLETLCGDSLPSISSRYRGRTCWMFQHGRGASPRVLAGRELRMTDNDQTGNCGLQQHIRVSGRGTVRAHYRGNGYD